MSSGKPLNQCNECGYYLDEKGHCSRCAGVRISLLGIMVALFVPCLGFGTCIFGYGTNGQVIPPYFLLGNVIMLAGPVIGLVIYLIGKRVKDRVD